MINQSFISKNNNSSINSIKTCRITLFQNNWNTDIFPFTYQININGIIADESSQLIRVSSVSNKEYHKEISRCQIKASQQLENSLIFTSNLIPNCNIEYYISWEDYEKEENEEIEEENVYPIIREYFNYRDQDDFRNSTYRNNITSAYFTLESAPSTGILGGPWDVSEAKNNSVTAWCVDDGLGTSTYKLYISGNGKEVIANKNSGHLFDNFEQLKLVDFTNFNTANAEDMTSMFDMSEYLETIIWGDKFITSNVKSMESMFDWCCALTSLDLSHFDTSKVENMNHMFYNCIALTNLNLSSFNTSNVKYMEEMFNDVIAPLDLRHWDVSNVISMRGLFGYYAGATQPNCEGWNTSNVKDLSDLFEFTNFSSIDLSFIKDTSNVENMSGMFDGCEMLTSIDLSHFNTKNVTQLDHMFQGCLALKSINVSHFDTSKVKDISYMFDQCDALTSIDISTWDIDEVKDASYFARLCPVLTTVKIPNWENCNNLIDASYMFDRCTSLTSFNGGEEFYFDTADDEIPNTTNMFRDCNALTSITLGDYWNHIKGTPFNGWTSSQTIYINGKNDISDFQYVSPNWSGSAAVIYNG